MFQVQGLFFGGAVARVSEGWGRVHFVFGWQCVFKSLALGSFADLGVWV